MTFVSLTFIFQGQKCNVTIEGPLQNTLVFTWSKSDGPFWDRPTDQQRDRDATQNSTHWWVSWYPGMGNNLTKLLTTVEFSTLFQDTVYTVSQKTAPLRYMW